MSYMVIFILQLRWQVLSHQDLGNTFHNRIKASVNICNQRELLIPAHRKIPATSLVHPWSRSETFLEAPTWSTWGGIHEKIQNSLTSKNPLKNSSCKKQVCGLFPVSKKLVAQLSALQHRTFWLCSPKSNVTEFKAWGRNRTLRSSHVSSGGRAA